MDRRWLLALVVCFTSTAVLQADVRGLPVMPEMRHVTAPRVRFEGVTKHPDYIFFLQYTFAPDDPHSPAYPQHAIEISDENALELGISWHDFQSMELYAIKRTEAVHLDYKNVKFGWFIENATGVVTVKLEPPETSIPKTLFWRISKDPLTTYRIHLEGNTLKVDNTSKDKRRGQAPLGHLPPIMIGLAISLSFATMGLWLVRRRSGTL